MPGQKLGTIVVALRLEDHHLEAIRAAAPGAEVVKINGRDEWRVRRAELESTVEVIAGVQGSDNLDLASMPRLRWIQTGGAGNDWLIRSAEIANSDVMVTNGSGVAAIPIAEHVLAMMFALSRQIPRFTRSQLDHEWYRGERLAEVDGSTMGVVGLGAIGEKTAEKARGLNMRVLGLRRDPTRSSPHVDRMLGPDGLMELLEVSDWVVPRQRTHVKDARPDRRTGTKDHEGHGLFDQHRPRRAGAGGGSGPGPAGGLDRGRGPRRVRTRAAAVGFAALGHEQCPDQFALLAFHAALQ